MAKSKRKWNGTKKDKDLSGRDLSEICLVAIESDSHFIMRSSPLAGEGLDILYERGERPGAYRGCSVNR